MKRKSGILGLAVLLAFILTGCVMEKTREDIIEKLEKEDIIESDWEYEYMIVNDASPIPDISSYDYIYTCNNETYMVRIQGKDKEDKYPVYIAGNIEIEEYEWTDSDGKKSVTRDVVHYEIIASYKLQYKQFLWFKYLIIAEE